MIGIIGVIIVFVMVFGGYMIDGWLGTTPLFAFIGLGFGVAAAIRNLLQTVASDKDA